MKAVIRFAKADVGFVPHTSRWCLAKANVCFLGWKWKIKLPPNEFTRLILKGRGPRRRALRLGAPVHGPVSQLHGLGTVTPHRWSTDLLQTKPSGPN